MSLAQSATFTRKRSYKSIQRAEGRRVIHVTADIIPGKAEVRKVLDSLRRVRCGAYKKSIQCSLILLRVNAVGKGNPWHRCEWDLC